MTDKKKAIAVILKIEILVGLGGAAATAALVDVQYATAFLCGVVLTILNLLLLSLIWISAETKKSVAWIAGIIVLKYPLLGLIAYVVIRIAQLPPAGFAAGVATVVVSSSILPLIKSSDI